MADQDFKIVITSTADTSGFKQATVATGDLVAAGNKSADAASLQTLKHGELKKILQEMGNATVPGLGRSLSQLALGPVGAAMALVGAYQMLKGKLDDADGAMNALADDAAQPIGSGIEAYRRSLDEARVALGNFYAALKHAGVDNDPIKTEIDRAKALADAKLEAENKVREAMGLPPLDKIRDSAALMAEQSDRESAAPGLEKDAAAKRSAADEAKRKLVDDQDALARLRSILNDPKNPTYQKMVGDEEAAAKNLERVQNIQRIAPNAQAKAALQAEVDAAQANYNSVFAVRGNYRTRLGQLESGLTERSQTAADSEMSATEAEGQFKQNTARLRQLPGLLSHAQKLEGAQEDSAKLVNVLNTRGGQLNMTIGEMAEKTGKSHDQTLKIISGVVAGTLRRDTVIAQLEQQVRALSRFK